MGIRLTQTAPDRPIEILPDGKGDQALAQYIARLIQADIRYKEAQARDKGGEVEKAVATITKDGSVQAVSKSAAIGELQKAVDTWQGRAYEPGLDGDLKQWLLSKAGLAKAEIDRLEGREVRKAEAKPSGPITVSIPR